LARESCIFRSAMRFDLFAEQLLEWNKKFNLTSIIEPEDIRIKHFEDSLALSKAFDFSSGSPKVIDIGSGAGFPGLPLKMAFPNIILTLLEATKKKTEFLKHASAVLGLDNVEVVWGRAEDYARQRREIFDVAACRALGPLRTAVELCLPFVRPGGVFLAMKGPCAQQEIKEAQKAIKLLGGSIKEVISYRIKDNDRAIIAIKKTGKTPERYPRRAGIPKKDPL